MPHSRSFGSDVVGHVYVTATVTVWDEDGRVADEKLRLVEKAIQSRDFTCMVETVNAIEAWLASLPGHVYAAICSSAAQRGLSSQQR
jgi:type IV secretion system protein VirB4